MIRGSDDFNTPMMHRYIQMVGMAIPNHFGFELKVALRFACPEKRAPNRAYRSP